MTFIDEREGSKVGQTEFGLRKVDQLIAWIVDDRAVYERGGHVYSKDEGAK